MIFSQKYNVNGFFPSFYVPLFFVFLLSLLMGCKKPESSVLMLFDAKTASPEHVLKEFIELSIGQHGEPSSDRLANLCIGPLKDAFLHMDPHVFTSNYIGKKIVLKKLTIVSSEPVKKTSPDEADRWDIHYKVQIENPTGSDPTFESNERKVELVKTTDGWKIDNLKLTGKDKLIFSRGMIF